MNNPDVSIPTVASAPPSPGWILVVDDDATMLELIALVLRTEGWEVRTATGADSALILVKEAPTPPKLLICDVLMAGVDGLELTRRLLAKVPDLKAIVISAHLEEVAWWPRDLQRCPFLPKPFKTEQLVKAVAQAMV